MLKKCVFLFVVAALFFGGFMVPTGSAQAARPQPPAIEGIQPPELDFSNPPETIQKAVQLQDSLTPEQHAAGRTILDKYLPEVRAIHEAMAAQGKPVHNQLTKTDPALVQRMNDLVNNIEAEMAGVLNSEQFAMWLAVTKPTLPGMEAKAASGMGVEGYYTDYCLYGAYENAGTWANGYWGYYYGYLDYYYYGGELSYNAYYYAFYAMTYADYALQFSGWVYFASGYWNQWYTDYPSNAYYWSYYAEYYFYYAYYYAYWNWYYYSTGYDYAYYGYAYDYNAYYYADWAEYDTYWCYYYLY
jgi:hypothetical protein